MSRAMFTLLVLSVSLQQGDPRVLSHQPPSGRGDLPLAVPGEEAGLRRRPGPLGVQGAAGEQGAEVRGEREEGGLLWATRLYTQAVTISHR